MPDTSRSFEVSATRRIAAPADAVYRVFADYEVAHPRILPPSFFVGLRIEQGGYGAGTVILVEGRYGKPRVIRGIVTEPEPGRLLVETYPEQGMVTSFRVLASGSSACDVTISTVIPRRRGLLGWLEERFLRRLLTRVFAQELELVAEYLARAG
jgi:hypothetical protein